MIGGISNFANIFIPLAICLCHCRGFDWPEEESQASGAGNPPAFAVSALAPSDGLISVPVSSVITVNFSKSVNTTTLTYQAATAACAGNSLEMSPDDFVTCVGFAPPTWNATQRVLTMTPATALSQNTLYKVRIAATVAAAGGAPLSSSYTSAGFTTVGPVTLALIATNPSDAGTGVSLNTTLAVTFNTQMNTGTVIVNASAGSCTGTLQVSADNFASCAGWNSPVWTGPASQVTFSPSGPLSPGTVYKIKITTGVAGLGGEVLSAEVMTPTGFSTTISPPASPQVFSSNARNMIVWSAVAGASSYNIYFSTSPGVAVGTGTLISGVAAPYTHNGLTNGATYYYIVTGANGAIVGQPSSQVAATPVAFKRMFVTSTSYSGALGGIAGADTNCSTRASAASLPGQYRAYISDSTNDAVCRALGLSGKLSANCGLPVAPDLTAIGPYQNTGGQVINVSLDSLIYGKAPTTPTCTGGSPSLLNPVGFDESGTPAVTSPFTGTECGVQSGANCSDWSSSLLENALMGNAASTGSTWSSNGSVLSCLTGAPLYCVQY
jgi:Bacterial Ig-like domain